MAEIVCKVIGFEGKLVFDTSRPDGTPRKLLDVGRLRSLGWRESTTLEDGLRECHQDFMRQYPDLV